MSFNYIKEQYQNVLQSLGNEANLIAVSKRQPIEKIQFLYDLGHRDFGENTVQELTHKAQSLDYPDLRWHFIGHLQTNKINQLLKIPNLVSIHSIDSIKLLNKIISKEIDKKLELFLQINTSNEAQKQGFSIEDDLSIAIDRINSSGHIFKGLMTIGKIRTTSFEDDATSCFSELSNLKQNLGLNCDLSMGMSNDYLLAIQMGSNWVRVGSKIFGDRG